MLFVFYSGHADAEALHLGGTRLSLDELQNLTVGSPAQTRVLVVDSCRSGALTRVKGGRQGPSFEIRTSPAAAASGFAILTSSAAGEDAQESDQLQASVFTHHLVSGLLGAADDNRDGRISIDEAFSYAAARTLASTALSLPGPQHPTYRLDVRGRTDVWLTEPGARTGSRGVLSFPSQGTYLVQSGGFDGSIIAELSADSPGNAHCGRRPLLHLRTESAIPAPRDVRRRSPRNDARAVRGDAAGRLRARGAQGRNRSHPLVERLRAGGHARRPARSGRAAGARLGARLDLRPLSLELAASAARADRENSRLDIVSYETAISVTGLHVFDSVPLFAGVGTGDWRRLAGAKIQRPGNAQSRRPRGSAGASAAG